MALFTDGTLSVLADLFDYESDVQEMASAEGIELTTKLRLAQTEIGAHIEASSRRPGNTFFAREAGWQSTGSDVSLPRFSLDQVAVTPPLKLWHTFHSLALVYRDAITRKVGDRYMPKWKEYKELSRWAMDLLFQTGVGVVITPIPRAPEPEFGSQPSAAPATAAVVRVAWSGPDGVEGAPSIERGVSRPSNESLTVSVGEAPTNVTGWNVYAGAKKDHLSKQNAGPLDLTETWVMPETGLIDGDPIGNGQGPDVFRTAPRFLQRG